MTKTMRSRTFWILTALAERPRNGHGLRRKVSARVTLPVGTMFAILDRLCADGLVEVDRDEWVEGRERRYYRLSAAGDAMLVSPAAREWRESTTPAVTRAELRAA
ncbi:PadR family transcriptional regulator [Actinoplanes sp. CA-054009]